MPIRYRFILAAILGLLLSCAHPSAENPNSAAAARAYFKVLELQKSGFVITTEQLSYIDQAIALEPRASTYHETRGNLLSTMLRFQEARAAYDRAIEFGDRPYLRFERAHSACALGDFAAAAQDLTVAINAQPQNLQFYMPRAIARAALGDDPGARHDAIHAAVPSLPERLGRVRWPEAVSLVANHEAPREWRSDDLPGCQAALRSAERLMANAIAPGAPSPGTPPPQASPSQTMPISAPNAREAPFPRVWQVDSGEGNRLVVDVSDDGPIEKAIAPERLTVIDEHGLRTAMRIAIRRECAKSCDEESHCRLVADYRFDGQPLGSYAVAFDAAVALRADVNATVPRAIQERIVKFANASVDPSDGPVLRYSGFIEHQRFYVLIDDVNSVIHMRIVVEQRSRLRAIEVPDHRAFC